MDDILKQIETFMQEKAEQKNNNESKPIYYIGLNKGPQVLRLYMPNLPKFRKSPYEPKIVWTSRLLDPINDTLKRVFWPMKEDYSLDLDFMPLKVLYSYRRDSAVITKNKKSTNTFPQSPYPKKRILINAYDRITNRIGVLCEKVFYPNSDSLGYPTDIGISETLFSLLLELFSTIGTIDIDVFIHRKVEGNKVLYSLREYSENLNHKYLSQYGKREKPNFDQLINLDDISQITDENYIKQKFPYLSAPILNDGSSSLTSEEKSILESIAKKQL